MKFQTEATVRAEVGKGAARQLRRRGKIPAILYGEGKSVHLTMDPTAVRKILIAQGGSTGLVSLAIHRDGTEREERLAVIQDFQRDPITGHLLHVDLFEVSMDKPIRVKVQVHVVGETPIGVKRDKGILHYGLRELHIECLPGAIPERFDVDPSALEIGQGIYIRDLRPSAGIRLLDDPDQMVVNVSAPMSEEKLAALLSTVAVEPTVAAAPEAVAAPAAAPAAEKGKAEAAPAAGKAGGAAPAAGKPSEGKK